MKVKEFKQLLDNFTLFYVTDEEETIDEVYFKDDIIPPDIDNSEIESITTGVGVINLTIKGA